VAWLQITDALPGDACPLCDRGELYVRSSRPVGQRWQVQYLWCKSCPATFKARVERRHLARARTNG
jgi:hypothetical protein